MPPQNSGDSAVVLNPLILSVGALVEVDPEHRNGRPDSDGGKAWMQSFNHEYDRGTVSYMIDRCMSLDIEPERLYQASLMTFARRNRRNNKSDGRRPSILTPANRDNHLRSHSNNNNTNPHGTQQFGIVNVFAKSRHWDSSRNS